MKVGIVQPYLFPYLGYFQLINEVDDFVFFDDVNYIKKGWINKNRVLNANEIYSFSVPIKKASQNVRIMDTFIHDYISWRDGFIQSIYQFYKNAPHFEEANELLKSVLFQEEYESISDLCMTSILKTSEYLKIDTRFLKSSELEYNRENRGVDKVIEITKQLGGTHYINPINGQHLYDRGYFDKQNLLLNFIKMSESINYRQWDDDNFVSHLSILDVLMFVDRKELKTVLTDYELV